MRLKMSTTIIFSVFFHSRIYSCCCLARSLPLFPFYVCFNCCRLFLQQQCCRDTRPNKLNAAVTAISIGHSGYCSTFLRSGNVENQRR